MVAGCASHPSARRSAAPTTTLITQDVWRLPTVSGPPSQQNFCILLTATYTHVGELTKAADTRVKEQIVGDFVNATPAVIAAAPAGISAPARTYFTAVSEILQAFEKAGLNATKLPTGGLGPVLLDPKVKDAANQVLAYSDSECHYAIGAG